MHVEGVEDSDGDGDGDSDGDSDSDSDGDSHGDSHGDVDIRCRRMKRISAQHDAFPIRGPSRTGVRRESGRSRTGGGTLAIQK
jgi:hypothetical protein